MKKYKISKEYLEMMLKSRFVNPHDFVWDDNKITFMAEGQLGKEYHLDELIGKINTMTIENVGLRGAVNGLQGALLIAIKGYGNNESSVEDS
jgi:hypothetical protein